MTANVHLPTDKPELIAERLFDAPRELVFKAWTVPAIITNWWGPRGFSTTTHEMDFRAGGVWRFTMHGPDGTDYPNKIVYPRSSNRNESSTTSPAKATTRTTCSKST